MADYAQLPLRLGFSEGSPYHRGDTWLPDDLPPVAGVFGDFYSPDGDLLTVGASGQRFVYVFRLSAYQPLLVFHNHPSWCCN